MFEEKLISVIVPVFNVEDYINRCVESLLKQTYKKIEIILIDDGSTDKSGIVCDDYARMDERVVAIHKKNGGLSDARNAGLNICTGEYITFVDSDDYLESDCIERLFLAIQKTNADVACCEMKIITDNGRILNHYSNSLCLNEYVGRSATKELLLMRGIDTSAPGKLYRKELFISRRYPVGKLFEDIPVMYDIVLNEKKFTHICYPGYYYFYREDSISKKQFSPKRMDGFQFMEESIHQTLSKYPDLKKISLVARFINAFNILIIMKSPNEYKNSYRIIRKEIHKTRWEAFINKESKNSIRIKALISFLPTALIRYINDIWQRKK